MNGETARLSRASSVRRARLVQATAHFTVLCRLPEGCREDSLIAGPAGQASTLERASTGRHAGKRDVPATGLALHTRSCRRWVANQLHRARLASWPDGDMRQRRRSYSTRHSRLCRALRARCPHYRGLMRRDRRTERASHVASCYKEVQIAERHRRAGVRRGEPHNHGHVALDTSGAPASASLTQTPGLRVHRAHVHPPCPLNMLGHLTARDTGSAKPICLAASARHGVHYAKGTTSLEVNQTAPKSP